MDTSQEIIGLAKKAETLKVIGRNGWTLAGVLCKRQESVGEHSYGTILVSLLVSKILTDKGESVNLGQVALMATLHDLPESIISDIPLAATQLGGKQLKEGKVEAEKKAVRMMSESSELFGEWFMNLWNDLAKLDSIEARIVRGADIIDMLVHALALETSGVSPSILDQFFKTGFASLKQLKLEIIENTFWELYREHIDNAKRMGIELERINRD